MRKEVLVAILIGVILGALVAFGIWRANLALLPKKEAVKTEQQPQPSPAEVPASTLILTQPEDNAILSQDKAMIKGATIPGATVLILTNLDELVTQADKNGAFEQEVQLEGGPNEITVISYDEAGNETAQTLTLVYSTEFTKEQ